jgi:hypothetical protein
VQRRFSYEVLVNARPQLAWEIFSNIRRWHTFANVYGRLHWTKGEPWTVGSRLSIEILRPLHLIIDHVITHCDPAEKVGWIDHGLGVSIDQWVTFQPRNGTGTLIRVTGEILGPELEITPGVTLDQYVREFTRSWYESYREVCNQLAPIAGK